jgi:molecular chaperone HscB
MTATPTVKCWGCGGEAPGGDLCPECGRLQPFAEGSDHWAVLGLGRRLALDRTELERRCHELNRRFHPDYFRLRAAEEQAISLENSAAVNSAYRTLRDPIARVEYLLAQAGMALGTAGQARPPADLFEEIMELQEAREELEGAESDQVPALRVRLEAARAELDGRRARTEPALMALFPRWEAAADAERGALLGEMRDLLAERAYLKTIVRDLDTTLEGRPA